MRDWHGYATRESWRAEHDSVHHFKFAKVWIENAFPIEIMTPAQAAEYTAVFDREGLTAIGHELRKIESVLTAARSEHAG